MNRVFRDPVGGCCDEFERYYGEYRCFYSEINPINNLGEYLIYVPWNKMKISIRYCPWCRKEIAWRPDEDRKA